MPSIRSLAIALTAFAGSFANAGPCSVSAPATTTTPSASVPTTATSTSDSASTTTTSSSTSAPTTTAFSTTFVATTCTTYDPAPTNLHCGGAGTPVGLTVIDTANNVSLNDCALLCYNYNSEDCLTFTYSMGICQLYGDPGSLVKRVPTSTPGPEWFQIGCFDCGGPTSTASSTTVHTVVGVSP